MHRPSRKTGLLVSSAVCGALALATTGSALASIDDAPASGVTTPDAPLPGTETIAAQARALGLAAGVLKPVTDLITSVLGVPDGRLWPGQAARLATAVRNAIAAAQRTGPAPPLTPAPVAPPAAPDVPPVSRPDNGTRAKPAGTAAALKAKALADLQAKADALLRASAAGEPDAITSALAATVTGLVNVLVSVALGSGLPAPSLPGLPSLPH